MKRIIKIISLIAILILTLSTCVFAESATAKITLNGSEVSSDTAPVIVDGRVLVPARAIFEKMGGAVIWDNELRVVTVKINGTTVALTVGSNVASVNGKNQSMDVPANIINERTMVPLRFISEAVGSTVSWDNDTRTVNILDSTDSGRIIVQPVVLTETDVEYKITATTNNKMEYNTFSLDDPNRFIVDISNANLQSKQSIAADSAGIVENVRIGQKDEDVVRLVVDLSAFATPKVTASQDGKTLNIIFSKSEAEESNVSRGGSTDYTTGSGGTAVNHTVSEFLVFLDAGHGGTDSGSVGHLENSEAVYEKDINLKVAIKLNELLNTAGIHTYMVRSSDVEIPLYDRQDKANELNAALYVAIHNNSFIKSTVHGTEVLYSSDDAAPINGISGASFAKLAQEEMVSELGTSGRRARTSPELAVIRRTNMTAIVVEGAFLSNPDDLKLITSDSYADKYALAMSRAIITTLNSAYK